jgi:hypothetical protein
MFKDKPAKFEYVLVGDIAAVSVRLASRGLAIWSHRADDRKEHLMRL